MKVAHASFYVDPQGRDPDTLLHAWPTLSGVASALVAAGVDVTVVQAASEDAERDLAGVRYRFVAEPAPRRLHRRLGLWASPGGARVAAAVHACGADVVHVHGLGFPRQTARIRGAPRIVQDHADRPPHRWLAGLWRHALEGAVTAFTAKEQARPFVEARALAPEAPVAEVLESSTQFAPGDRSEARIRTGLHGDPCCLWLGRLDGNKDPLTALAAFERVLDREPDARLWMFWRSGPLEAAVRARIADSPALRGRVHAGGALPHAEVEHVLRAADLLVQPSHREGSGYAVLEALACGTLPVVTDIPSFRRMVGDLAPLVPPGDAPALAAAILGADPTTARRAAARAHFEAHLDFRAVARELIAAYRMAP